MTVGKSIRKHRLSKGLTQKQLGELCDIAESAIRRYESDRVRPKLETLGRIATALEIHCKDILADTNDTKRALLYGNDFLVRAEELGDILIETQRTDTCTIAEAALYDFLNQNHFTEHEYEMILQFAKDMKNNTFT